MNAYELADRVDGWAEDVYGGGQQLKDAANMLRQQADRIAKLEKELQRIVANAEFELDRATQTKSQADIEFEADREYWRNKELKTNPEPVAFIKQGADGKPTLVKNPLHEFSYQAESAKWADIPLYTTPQTKPLSDSELIVFLMDDIDKASQWLVEGQTHMAIGVLGQCHAEIRKHLSKKSKPLSDEEIEQIYYKDFNYEDADMVKFARAIEERHGIK